MALAPFCTRNMTAKASIPVLLVLFALASAAPGRERDTRTCRILFLEGPDSAPRSLHLFDGSGSRKVELPRMNLSQVYELPPGNLNLALLPSPPDDSSKLPAGAPAVRVPEEYTDFYLLLTSDPSNKIAPVSMQVINAGMDRLRAGQMLWFNLTEHQVGGRIGSETLVMRPKSTATLDPPAAGSKDYPVDLSYRIQGKEHLYPICETKWLHDPRNRSLAFIFSKPGTRTPRVLVFSDSREAEKLKPESVRQDGE
jgi:hypothetical protein